MWWFIYFQIISKLDSVEKFSTDPSRSLSDNHPGPDHVILSEAKDLIIADGYPPGFFG
jgi:hypothetical protein